MATISQWEQSFQSWSQGPGKTESERCANAVRIIKDCLQGAGLLDKYRLEVFVQGSYANRTNIPQESDVDLCAVSMRGFFPEYPPTMTKADFGHVDSDFRFPDLKNDVGNALSSRFGGEVSRGDKCFAIHSNSNRVDTDVTPSIEHRRYQWPDRRASYVSGCEFWTDSGKPIINWPKQHIENGERKNIAVNRRFKRVVRILKHLQFDMIDAGKITERIIPSYAIECAAYNVPNDMFLNEPYYASVRRALAVIFNATLDDERCKEWVEVNGLKWLFRGSKPWTREQVHRFAGMAWDHVGYT